MDMKQIIVDFLKWDCEVLYGTSVGYEDGISKKADEYLHLQLLQQTQCTALLICPECENPYPHSHTDGSYSCEDCGHKWAN